MAERGIQRTHDGVPKFDGTPELMSLYREEAVQFLMTFEHRKRYLAGPRLLKELEGTAKMSVRTMTLRDPQWVSHPRGVYTLLDHLEATIARPSLPEASRFVMRFFYNLQRKKQETMTSWIRGSTLGGLAKPSQGPKGVRSSVEAGVMVSRYPNHWQ